MTAEAAAHVNEPVPSASERERRLPRAVDAVFQRGLAKRREDRSPSARAFVPALRDGLRALATAETLGLPAAPAPVARPAGRWPYILALLLLRALAGGILVFALTRGGDHKTLVKTIQGKPRTITQVTTSPTSAPPPPPASSPPPAPPAPVSQSGAALNNAGFTKMKAGDYQGALPLLVQAVAKLQGTGSLDEAYADYNLASTRLHLGSCDGVKDLLKNSQRIQHHRVEIDAALAQEKSQCKGGGAGD